MKQVNTIWTGEELALLRRNWQQSKEENMSLKSRLQSAQDELAELRERLARAEHEIKQCPTDAVRSLEQENERLYIRVQELESRYASYAHEFTAADKAVDEARKETGQTKAKLNALVTDKSRLEYELNKCRLKLKLATSECTLKMEEQNEKIRIEYSQQINALKRSLTELQEKYSQEVNEHSKCKKALENLRTHFMSAELEKIRPDTSKLDQSKIRLF